MKPEEPAWYGKGLVLVMSREAEVLKVCRPEELVDSLKQPGWKVLLLVDLDQAAGGEEG